MVSLGPGWETLWNSVLLFQPSLARERGLEHGQLLRGDTASRRGCFSRLTATHDIPLGTRPNINKEALFSSWNQFGP
jgi:hypothetical protein